MTTISTNQKVRRETVRRPVAALGSAVFFVVGAGIVAGLIPWFSTGWRMREPVAY